MDIISSAYAAAPAAGASVSESGASSLIMLGIFFVVFYFLLWRPQAKRAKEQRALIAGLTLGEEVLTAGGVVGRITKINENFIVLMVAEGVNLTVQRSSVSAVLPKGTLQA